MKYYIAFILTFMSLSTKLFSQENYRIGCKEYEIRATIVTLSSASIRIVTSQKGIDFFLRILINREKMEIEIEEEKFTEPIAGKTISDAKKSFTRSLSSAIKKSKLSLCKDADYISKQIVNLLDSHPLNCNSDKFLWEQVLMLDEIPIFF